MAYWLFKSEPNIWSWEQQKAKGAAGEEWTCVRNYQARNFMRAMQLKDQGFFYHSNHGKEIVGIVEICQCAQPDTSSADPRWEAVWVRAVAELATPVSLAQIKAEPRLHTMVLVTHSRLSVQPVSTEEWQLICTMTKTIDSL